MIITRFFCMNLHTNRSRPQQPSAMNCKVTMYLKTQQWQHCKEHDTKYLNTQDCLPSLKSQLFLAYASNSKFLSVVFEMSKQLQVNVHFCLVAPWWLTEKQCFYVQGDNPLVFTTPPPFKTVDDFCDSAANTPLVDMLFTAATPPYCANEHRRRAPHHCNTKRSRVYSTVSMH